MNDSRISKTLSYIISISFILMAFLGTVHFCCFDENFYLREHNKLMLYGKHINEHIGISNEELKELTSFTLSYLNDPNASLDKQMIIKGKNREVFNDSEKEHMVDVRRLNICSIYICIFATIVFITSVIIFMVKKYNLNILFMKYKKTLIYTLVFFLILGIWIICDFDSFWTLFHHIFFKGNNLWILDLNTDILIMIVPPEFFNHLVIRIIGLFVLVVLIFYYLLFKLNKKVYIND